MSKKVVFISLPMSGLDDDVITENILSAKEEYLKRTKKDISEIAFVCNFLGEKERPSYYRYNEPALKYLGRAIDTLGRVDEVFFYGNWEEARGCLIEHKVCELYDIPYMEV